MLGLSSQVYFGGRAEMEGAAREDEAFSSRGKAFSSHFKVFDDLLWRQNVRDLVLVLRS